MNLRNGTPFWAIHEGSQGVYPPLTADRDCDVLVVGGGITGALVAHRLSQEGHRCVVLDKRDIGWGSTMGSTAMLQYEIDVSLTDLVKKIGKEDAIAAYRLCASAVGLLDDLTASLPDRCGFVRCTSLFLAREEDEMEDLRTECRLRKEAGLEVTILERAELQSQYGLTRPGAIKSRTAARVEPYRLTHVLLKEAIARGCEVFDRTAVAEMTQTPAGWRIKTDRGPLLNARRAVFCTGFESQQMIKEKIVRLTSTFAVATEPLSNPPAWLDDHLLWETGDAYFYLRAGPDGRVLMGGEDTPFKSDAASDRVLVRKADNLAAACADLLSQPVETAYSWAGVFGRTADGLGYFGQTPQYPGIDWVLGFGGNGITFSAVMARMLADVYAGRPTPLAHLFRFGR